MAVGVIGEEKPRYFSIVRWGDAELTLAQVKRRLRIEKWLLLLTATGGIGFFAVMLAAMAYVG
jgi:NADPH:quinone reductase-like Zn-dependent oxidoreductase